MKNTVRILASMGQISDHWAHILKTSAIQLRIDNVLQIAVTTMSGFSVDR